MQNWSLRSTVMDMTFKSPIIILWEIYFEGNLNYNPLLLKKLYAISCPTCLLKTLCLWASFSWHVLEGRTTVSPNSSHWLSKLSYHPVCRFPCPAEWMERQDHTKQRQELEGKYFFLSPRIWGMNSIMVTYCYWGTLHKPWKI